MMSASLLLSHEESILGLQDSGDNYSFGTLTLLNVGFIPIMGRA